MRSTFTIRPVKHLAPTLLFLATALLLPRLAAAGVMTANQEVTQCVNNDGEIDCAKKVLVSVGVSYGAEATLNVAYIDTVTVGGVETQSLEPEIRFEISKTLPKFIYPLRYLHLVPYNPHEEVREIRNASVGISSCVDGPTADRPSCDWTLDGAGNRIPDSQGFCSNRDLLDLKSCGDSPSSWRGEELNPPKQSTLADSFSTAHCLREGEVYFTGYEIDPPRRDYEVATRVMKGSELLFSPFTVKPDSPVHLVTKGGSNPDPNAQHQIMARLVGEDPPPVAPPDLSGYILYVPTNPPTHPMVVDFQNNMLLVPRHMVAPDGTECNKVGTSFAAFRNQGAVAPTTVAGDCLGNQLYQLHQDDLALLLRDPGAETKYLVSGKRRLRQFSLDRNLELQVPSPELNYSTVALELDPAQLGSTTYEALGIIDRQFVPDINGLDIVAMSGNQTWSGRIQNTGTVRANFIITVSECWPGIVGAIPAQARTVSPGEWSDYTFDFAANRNVEGRYRCHAYLRTETGRQLDDVWIVINTQKHDTVYPRNLYLKNREGRKATP